MHMERLKTKIGIVLSSRNSELLFKLCLYTMAVLLEFYHQREPTSLT